MYPATINRAHPQLRGCLAWWPLAEGGGNKAYELLHGGHGTFAATTASPSRSRDARGPAVAFDGGDYINCGVISRFGGLAALTVCVRIRPATSGATISYFSANGSSDGTPPILLRTFSNNTVTAFLDTSAGTKSFDASGTGHAPANVTTHLAFVYNGANGFWVVNGRADSKVTAHTGTVDATSGDTLIGAWTSGSITDPFNGTIADVRLYNRALTAAEIRDIYLNPTAPFVGGLPITR